MCVLVLMVKAPIILEDWAIEPLEKAEEFA